MPARKFDLEYKRTDEYKALAAMVRDIAGPQPDYLVDIAIAYHLSNPNAYRQERRGGPAKIPPAPRYAEIDDAVTISDPPPSQNIEAESITDNDAADELLSSIPSAPLLRV